MNDLIDTAATFNADTKKMFKSCTFAALNIYGPRQDWQAWGDFNRKADAISAMRMWVTAFRKGCAIVIVGKAYRVSVNV